MRRLMNAVYSELEQAYISRGATPPEKLVDYFPQVYELNRKIYGLDGETALTYFLEAVFTKPDSSGQRISIDPRASGHGLTKNYG